MLMPSNRGSKFTGKLPRGWKAIKNNFALSPDAPTWIFFHAKTGTKSLERPQNELSWNYAGKVVPVIDETFRRDKVRDQEALELIPDGWEEIWSRSKPGTRAYIHTETGARTTVRPDELNQVELVRKWQQVPRKKIRDRHQKRLDKEENERKRSEEIDIPIESVESGLDSVHAPFLSMK